ncbi:MAG: twitch domain-containing radical SAM protein [Bdellovibrionota bacterium]
MAARQPACSAPWSHLYVDNDGWVYLCCRIERSDEDHSPSEWALKLFFHQFAFMGPDTFAPEDERNAEIRRAHELVQKSGSAYEKETLTLLHRLAGRHKGLSRPIGHIQEKSLEEIWASDEMDQVREEFLEGNFPENQCWRCQWELKQGIEESKVLLTHFNNQFPYKSVKKSYREGPASLNIHLGNLCNLKCVMCNAKYSSRHAGGRQLDPFTGNELFESSFKRLIPGFRALSFGGGEPLINENLFRYLELIVKAKSAAEITYTTNLTVLNPRFLAVLPKLFQSVLLVSIDGVGANYEKIRQGARWETVLENLTEVARHRVKYRIAHILVRMCVMPQNYMDIEPLLDLCREREVRLQFNLVYFPEALSPFKLEPKARLKIREALAALYARRKEDIDAWCDNFQGLSVI